MPVALPPGRARLATRPSRTGSSPTPKAIGIVAVAALAAIVGAFPGGAITATCRRTRSASSAGRRSRWPPSQWYSTVTFWPSTYPVSLRPLRNAAEKRGEGVSVGEAGSIAGQGAGCDKLAVFEDRRHSMVEGQRGELFAPSRKKRIGVDNEPARSQFDKVCENAIEVTFGASI